MAQLFSMVSWNIKQFSFRRSGKYVPELQEVRIKVWLARLLMRQASSVSCIMEVSLASGPRAISQLVNTLNEIAGMASDGVTNVYTYVVSAVNASGATGSRADRYAVIWCQTGATFQLQPPGSTPVTVTAVQVTAPQLGSVISPGIQWTDRAPFCWNVGAGSALVTMVLWHAPQPRHTLGAETVQELATLVEGFTSPYTSSRVVVAGDFNLKTSSAKDFVPLANLSFKAAFAGLRTTLTTVASFVKRHPEQFYDPHKYTEEFLANAYDDIFVKGVSFMDEIRPMVPYWILTELLSKGAGSIKLSTKLPSPPAVALAAALQISDHLPLSVTIAEIGTHGSIDLERLPEYVTVQGSGPAAEGEP